MWKRNNALRLDVVEVACVALLVAVCSWSVGRSTPRIPYTEAMIQQEVDQLRRQYGPKRYSERAEEWIIRDFFKDRRGGFFLDVGANHYRDASTTFFLEDRLGWSGIAVEPQVSFEEGYRRHRQRTRFFPFFASDSSNQSARLYLNDMSLVASAQPDFTRLFGRNLREMDVPTVTLTDLLDSLNVARIDFASIDVELSEPAVLRGFAIDRFHPALVCIEAHSAVRQQILDYFARHRYVAVGAYLRVDPQNLYFKPIGD